MVEGSGLYGRTRDLRLRRVSFGLCLSVWSTCNVSRSVTLLSFRTLLFA